MVSWKRGRMNQDFQILFFLAGSCHTIDGAYYLLLDQLEDRQRALNTAHANKLRQEANLMEWESILNKDDAFSWEKKRAEANIKEYNDNKEMNDRLYEACVSESTFLQKCIDHLDKHRKYKYSTPEEAQFLTQREEWLLEFRERIENHLLCTGTIPPAELEVFRTHPDFTAILVPYFKKLISMPNKLVLLEKLGDSPSANVLNNPAVKLLVKDKIVDLPALEAHAEKQLMLN